MDSIVGRVVRLNSGKSAQYGYVRLFEEDYFGEVDTHRFRVQCAASHEPTDNAILFAVHQLGGSVVLRIVNPPGAPERLFLLGSCRELNFTSYYFDVNHPNLPENIPDDCYSWTYEERDGHTFLHSANTDGNLSVRNQGEASLADDVSPYDRMCVTHDHRRGVGATYAYFEYITAEIVEDVPFGSFPAEITDFRDLLAPTNALSSESLEALVGTSSWTESLRAELRVGSHTFPLTRSVLSIFPSYEESSHCVELSSDLEAGSLDALSLLSLLAGDPSRITTVQQWHELYELFMADNMKEHALLCCEALDSLKKNRGMFAYLKQKILKKYGESFGQRTEEEETEGEEGEEEPTTPVTPCGDNIVFVSAFTLALVNSLHREENLSGPAIRYAMRVRLLEPITHHVPKDVRTHSDFGFDEVEEEATPLTFAELFTRHAKALREGRRLFNVELRVEDSIAIEAHLDILCLRSPSPFLELLQDEQISESFTQTRTLTLPGFPPLQNAIDALMDSFYTLSLSPQSLETLASLWTVAQQHDLKTLKPLLSKTLREIVTEETVLDAVGIVPRELFSSFVTESQVGMSVEEIVQESERRDVRRMKDRIGGLGERLEVMEQSVREFGERMGRVEGSLEEILKRLQEE